MPRKKKFPPNVVTTFVQRRNVQLLEEEDAKGDMKSRYLDLYLLWLHCEAYHGRDELCKECDPPIKLRDCAISRDVPDRLWCLISEIAWNHQDGFAGLSSGEILRVAERTTEEVEDIVGRVAEWSRGWSRSEIEKVRQFCVSAAI